MKEFVNKNGELTNFPEFEKSVIFKYGLFKDVKRTLENCTLGFSNLRDYNDLFENYFRYLYWFRNKSERDIYYNEFLNEGHHVNKIKKLVIEELEKYVITCFSKTPFEPLMWAHYSDKHKGICYCFDQNEIFDKYQYSFRNIRYSNLFPDINIYDGKLSLEQITPQVEEVILTKSDSWSYEKEFRFYLKSETKIHNYKPISLKGIILGNRVSKLEEIEIIELLNNYNLKNNTDIKIMYSTPSMYNYEMQIVYNRLNTITTTCPLFNSDSPIIT